MGKHVVHILCFFLLFGLVAGNLWAEKGAQIVEGEVSQVSPTHLILNGTYVRGKALGKAEVQQALHGLVNAQ